MKEPRFSESGFFLPGQERFVQDRGQRIIVEKARQTGFSFTAAYRLVKQTSQRKWGWDAWVSSRDEIQAQLFGDDCEGWAKVLGKHHADLGVRVLDEARKITAHTLAFANECAINSMSSNPDAQAGKRGTRLLDEFALHSDPRQLYNIAKPGLDWGGDLVIISTHRGTANFFNELINEVKHQGNPKGFNLHTVTIVDAVDQGLLEKRKAKWMADDPRQSLTRDEYLQRLRNECADEESWQQEYMCQPADDLSAFLSYDLIAGCEYRHGESWRFEVSSLRLQPTAETGVSNRLDNPSASSALGAAAGWDSPRSAEISGPLYVGVDVGRDHDLTVIWVIEKLGDVAYTRAVVTMEKQTFEAQEHALYEWLGRPEVRRCCIDRTGLGRQFAERAVQRFGCYRVEGVNFTGAVKEELAYPVRSAFEDRTVRIPNDPLIRSDLRAIKKETTASGNLRFTADRGKNGHADRFWALALALHAAKARRVPRISVA